MPGSEFRWFSSERTRVLSQYGNGCWSLPKADRRIVGVGLKDLEFGWPIGMPLCRVLGADCSKGADHEMRCSRRLSERRRDWKQAAR